MAKLKLLVVIDMGHGGTDGGASANGIVEKIANYNTGMALKEFLENNGVKVILTRTGDNTMSLEARTNYANKVAKDYPGYKIVFISVHHNAGGGDRGEYIHSIYEGDSKALAVYIGDVMNSELGQQKKIYSKKSTTSNKDYYHVIRATSMPAIIVEVAFLDNKVDVQICDTVDEQKRNGRVIGKGVLNWAGITSSSKPIEPEKPVEKPSVDNKPKVASVEEGKKFVGSRCKELQEKLIKVGYDCGGYGVDGKYGNSTHEDLIYFQKKYGLVADGLAGTATFNKLDSVIKDMNKPVEKPKPPAPSKPKELWELSISGQIVKDLQSELNKQCNAKLKVDGYFGQSTLDKCIVVKKGAEGNITKIIQRRLNDLGYSTNGIDGKFYNGTHNAVVKLQKSRKLSTDGIVGKNTWKELFKK
ncbi:MAG: N-acetylmuramoyl-L-alanine amidase [Clostridium sp.]